ncbi:MAG: flagellar motor protein MotA [Proteobacteria bacterium]|nr:flagellar motor protein MotA [Pseudomonadota bacterium]
MTDPRRFLTRQILFVLLVGVLAWALYVTGPLYDAFLANPALNGLIATMLLLGIFYTLRQVQRLRPEVVWLESYRRTEGGITPARPPVLLGPMATMLGDGTRMSLSTISMTSLLDSISSRLDEAREITRYLTGLLIFLGLLGTFWGLLITINAVQETLQGLAGSGDTTALFGDLIAGLQAPISGMGTAFSSSLFGLSGALILGFLDLQTGQAQNRFYNELEEWLSGFTRLSAAGFGGGDQSVPAYVSALLEQTAESLDTLQRTIARGEEGRSSANQTLLALADRLSTLTDSMRAEQDLMVKLAESQMGMKPLLQQLSDLLQQQRSVTLDETSRAHLRNLDVYVMRLLEESAAGRNQLIEEFRSEIKFLARTLAVRERQEKQ